MTNTILQDEQLKITKILIFNYFFDKTNTILQLNGGTEECCPLGEETERVDIEIESDSILLFIEVKIDALQGKQQLERYINVAKKKSGSRPWGIIYLTKDGILPKEINDKEKVVGISWRKLAKALEVLTKQKSKLEPNNRGIWLAEQFIQHILTF